VGKFSSIGDIRISVAESVMTLMAENTNEGESAQEEIACVYSGEDLVIGFNSKFIEAALGHIETETITMELSSPTTAVILKPEKEEEQQNLIILVMPVRINN
ncbi:MAG: DNA polymerase III subunit beta, partial [Prosthecochloris sp.]